MMNVARNAVPFGVNDKRIITEHNLDFYIEKMRGKRYTAGLQVLREHLFLQVYVGVLGHRRFLFYRFRLYMVGERGLADGLDIDASIQVAASVCGH